MANQELPINQHEKPAAGYRGSLVYQQEYGYKLITLLINLHTLDEQSRVLTRACGLDITEEAEHIPSGPPLAAVDLYHFPVTDGTEIWVTIKGQPGGEQQARYTVQPDEVEEDSPFLWLHILRSSESVRIVTPLPCESDGERGEQHHAADTPMPGESRRCNAL